MKVICIDGVKSGTVGVRGLIACKSDEIYEGEIYNVCGNCVMNCNHGYYLSQMSPFNSYKIERFLPLSEINEMGLVEALQIEVLV